MSNVNKTGRPSLSAVISKPLSNKPIIKNNSTQITKPTNAHTTQFTQPTLLSRSKVPKTPTSTITPRTPIQTASALSPSASIATSDINNQVINTNIITQNTIRNYASAASNENSPSREQALLFNSIDGIPQKEYIVAIGKIISPKNIVFVSRISNNRFCIFLSSKQILDSLLEATQTITINEQIIQIRRLINPAKRIVISNVCPSIPNSVILDAFKNINVIPISEIAYLKAGINIEGYEHILSFRRQMFLNHEDIPKLPSSLLIYSNENQFRIFFTDDKITCFLCKSVGHTTSNCKTNIENKRENDDPHTINETNTPEHITAGQIEEVLPSTTPNEKLQLDQSTMDWSKEIELPSQTQSTFDETLNFPQIETYKRPISDSSSLKTPISPNILTSPTTTPIKGKVIKKIKVRSRSNSVNRQEKNPEEELEPVVEFFTVNESLPITFLQFKHILNNFTNKSLNIHSLTEDVKIDIPSLMDLLDQIRKIVNDRSLKTRLTKLTNLLFQALPPQ